MTMDMVGFIFLCWAIMQNFILAAFCIGMVPFIIDEIRRPLHTR